MRSPRGAKSSRSLPTPAPVVREYTLRLRGIRFQANIGTSREERAVLQEILVDVELTLPTASLPRKDRRQDVVDYDAVATCEVEAGSSQPHRLLETYVTRVVGRLL